MKKEFFFSVLNNLTVTLKITLPLFYNCFARYYDVSNGLRRNATLPSLCSVRYSSRQFKKQCKIN